jgi:hypothetical protein
MIYIQLHKLSLSLSHSLPLSQSLNKERKDGEQETKNKKNDGESFCIWGFEARGKTKKMRSKGDDQGTAGGGKKEMTEMAVRGATESKSKRMVH